MKKLTKIILFISIFFLICLFMANEAFPAKVSSVSGDAKVLKGSKWKKVRSGQKISDNAYIKLGSGSSISFSNGSSISGPAYLKVIDAKKGSATGGLKSKLQKMVSPRGNYTSTLGVRADDAPSAETRLQNLNDTIGNDIKLAAKYLKKGKYQKVFKKLSNKKIKKYLPVDKALAYLLLSDASYEMAEFKDAADFAGKIIVMKELKKNNIYFSAVMRKSYALNQMKKYDEAERVLLNYSFMAQKDAVMKEKLPAIYYYLGINYLDKGNKQGAKFCFEKVLKKYPSSNIKGEVENALKKIDKYLQQERIHKGKKRIKD